MNTALQQKLENLRHFSTRYEIAATHKDGRKVLIGYTPRKGRPGLLAMVRKNADKWVEFSGSKSITFGKKSADGATSGDWAINFSGRTQREAYINGELPFFTVTRQEAIPTEQAIECNGSAPLEVPFVLDGGSMVENLHLGNQLKMF